MKKRSIIIIVAVVLMAATVITVYAYLQNTVTQPNEFVIKENKEEVTEVYTEPTVMRMNDTFEKVVKVQNTGSSDQFVRVYLDFSDSRVRDKAKIVYSKNGVQQEAAWSGFLSDLPDDWHFVSTSDQDGTLLGGYFYYGKVLSPDEATPPLINGVKTDFTDAQGDTNTDNIRDFDIIVYSESVQTTEINAAGTVYTDNDWQQAWISFLSVSR